MPAQADISIINFIPDSQSALADRFGNLFYRFNASDRKT